MFSRLHILFRVLPVVFFLLWMNRAIADSPLPVQTVFIILMENHDWSTIVGTTNCPYINSLLPRASYCKGYYTPPGLHPSEPNYIWLEAGTNFGILDDSAANRIASTNHLVTQLIHAGISWKSYQEDLVGSPLVNQNKYVVRHDPMVFFNDVNGNTDYMTSHVRPYTELARDLQSNTVARYNFITPNLTNDMHDACSGCSSRVYGDLWLSHELPKIFASQAYSNRGAIFITWDEGNSSSSDGPLGMIVISPQAKGKGYFNSIHYTHSSTLRTMQNIFGVRPYLGDAANATDLSDLFDVPVPFGLTAPKMVNGSYRFAVTNLVASKTYYIEASSNLTAWATIKTNVSPPGSVSFADIYATNFTWRFYRARQAP
jgi:hypothetical protein